MMCRRCVMDESDPLISFDEAGICSHCHLWEKRWANKLGLEVGWPEIINHIKQARRGEYDAILGMSGGADSSWVYHLAKTQGLKVLPIHFDNGYDLPVATHNIRCLTDHWGDELRVVPVNGSEFRALQLAFLKSGTTGLEIPTDHAIKAVTYAVARDVRAAVILNGTNLATESHGTAAWADGHADWKYISGVAKRFGVELRSFPHYTMFDLVTWMRDFEWVSLLEYVKYNRGEAIDEMSRLYDYEPYGFKHMESRITRFLHGYIIPRRFGWDTRRSRLSAMVASGQMTRESALGMLSRPAYSAEEMETDKLMLCGNLGITLEEFEALMCLPLKHFADYPSYRRAFGGPLYRVARLIYRRGVSRALAPMVGCGVGWLTRRYTVPAAGAG